MGCGSSRIMVVEPVKPGMNETLPVHDSHRGDSAVSKNTTDSGVDLDTGEATVLPGTVPRILPPLRARSPGLIHESQRPESSVILEQLLSQGIIPAQPRVAGSGEAYSLMLDEAGRQRRRPPARLESLKILKEQGVTRKEDIEEKMRQVEERRKMREGELKNKLRAKSARPRGVAPVMDEEESPSELKLQTDADAFNLTPVAKKGNTGEETDQELTHSPELENYSSFQQSEDTSEVF